MKSIWYDKEVLSFAHTIGNSALKEACEFVRTDIRESMQDGDYRLWRSKKDGGPHWSSKPGIPPASDTEELKNSISWQTSGGDIGVSMSGDSPVSKPIFGINTNLIVAYIGTTNDKGIRHEMGYTWYSVKRPFLRPQLNKNHMELLSIFKKYFGK